ncbi:MULTISPECIES: response regulator transcription factor [Geobacillus]|jgi:two-component system, OmpR family, alkaline phosphatase synthesis response regulator PhoP|uniref:response regulator transcription factor n=2 Tax=Anoxybacillaceae TaxID=3120669 RepID=UPI0009C19600|nr:MULTISPECIES: response regulator transcription factor [Geobacillus]MEC5187115.1 two-component system alkaline phosphatase synthesis response regulator PhoP [Geobacillus thermodenitrificans]MED0662800.1 DNA-binding response regulator [Geobacillus thermodenitrificans]NNU85902.1 response regulator transcription factor [Geobacillus sp. MR]OQP11592.1 DNA-binding response regulator [Geobacillus sp. 47C-IIb]QNU32214.1 response regulator transcription factor [Geobacillus sp. 47C-IIb]
MGKKILVVDDEQPIVTLLSYNLEKAGFQVVAAYDGEEALEKVAFEQPALIILDLMLPKLDGVEVCKRLRQQQIMTPILMLTARDDEFDKVLGLELGADDYMTKPFSPREVVARVKAILRRTDLAQPAAEPSERLVIGELEIFPERYEATVGDKPLELTPKEFELLLHLARHKGRVLTRDQLLSAVWNYDFAGDTRIVDVHISHLREKIEEDTKKPVYIKTVRGLGYKLEEPRRV